MALKQSQWSTTGKLGTSVWLYGVMMDSKYYCLQCCAKFLIAHSLGLWLILTCLQTWSFGRLYEAEIEEVDQENRTAAVTFSGYGNAEVIPLQNLKAVEEGKQCKIDGSTKPKSKYVYDLSVINYPYFLLIRCFSGLTICSATDSWLTTNLVGFHFCSLSMFLGKSR